MQEINIKDCPYLFYDAENQKLQAYSELGSLVASQKPKNDIVEKVKRQLETDYSLYGNRNIETQGSNHGPFVDEVLKSVGLNPGDAWCCAYVFFVLQRCKIEIIKTGYVPTLETWADENKILFDSPEPYDIFIVYDGDGPFHTGFVTTVNGEKFSTIEGNTNIDGSANGNGIYKRERYINTCAFVRWKKL